MEQLPDQPRYWAFISYSSVDRRWAKWLLQRIENYRIPVDLQNRESDNPVPIRLRPLFRDRDELPGSSNLGKRIHEALRDSRYLIVLCSPNSAKSRWVDKEIRTFRELGKADRILVLILSGEPNSSVPETECFPEPLRGSFEPIAADLRKQGDGPARACIKIISGMIGAEFDQLYRRHERKTELQRLIWTTILLILVGTFAFLTVFALSQRDRAIENRKRADESLVEANYAREQAESLVNYMLFDLRDQLVPIGKTNLLGGVAKKVETYINELPDELDDTDETMRNRIGLLGNISRIYQATGEFEASRKASQQSLEISRELYNRLESTDDPVELVDRLHTLMVSHDKLGHSLRSEGAYRESVRHYLEAIKYGERLHETNSDAGEWLSRIGSGKHGLGHTYLLLGEADKAKECFDSCLSIFEKLVQRDPENTEWSKSLAAARMALGDWYLLRDNLSEAKPCYETAKQSFVDLLITDPNNFSYLHDLHVSCAKLGDVCKGLSGIEDARQHYNSALKHARALVSNDPENGQWLRSKAIVHQNLGNLPAEDGSESAREQLLLEAVDEFGKLLALQPRNPAWMSDLALSHHKLAEFYKQSGSYKNAFLQYNREQSLRIDLVGLEPGSVRRYNDVVDLSENMGDLLYLKLDELSAAKTLYESMLTPCKTLISFQPENPANYSKMCRSHHKIAEITGKIESGSSAELDHIGQALDCAIRAADLSVPGEDAWFKRKNEVILSYLRIGFFEKSTATGGWQTRLQESFEKAMIVVDEIHAEDPHSEDAKKFRSLLNGALNDPSL